MLKRHLGIIAAFALCSQTLSAADPPALISTQTLSPETALKLARAAQ